MSEPEPNPADYKVGYRNPPIETRFRPGQSGNPKGRPKGSRNLRTDLMEELDERIVVRENGRVRKLSKQRAAVKTLVTRTLKGDARAASLLFGVMMRVLDQDEGAGGLSEPLDEQELEILQTFERRLRGTAESKDTAPGEEQQEVSA